MIELGLEIIIDQIGNVSGLRKGRLEGKPVMVGSHLDTVGYAGIYDGPLGVLAGLEVIETLNEAKIETDYPIAVTFFTNEEGVRFQPDMNGSLVFSGAMDLDEALALSDKEGTLLGDELARIGYAGEHVPGAIGARAFIELHIEQGPRLETSNTSIGVIEKVQGISWIEISLEGQSNHAGTTPMHLRRDAAYGAARIINFIRELAVDMTEDQVATCGSLVVEPNLINVVAKKAVITVDLRNTSNQQLQLAEQALKRFLKQLSTEENLEISTRQLVRFDPVDFAPAIIDLIEQCANDCQLSNQRMPSGAGHDAQMMAAVCPTAMIFVPSVDGISHNIREYTEPTDIEAGVNVLLKAVVILSQQAVN